jgi:murein DD-endopeptidase MepM/ murein hydrolase activator NlpD
VIVAGTELLLPAAANVGVRAAQLPAAAAGAAPAPAVAALPRPAPRDSGRFAWPLRGTVLAGFGPQGGGIHNDGIDIAAAAGTPVAAAENGVVAYAGNELRGLGNLLLILHADGWITAYAHTQAILVRRGERVNRGQTVATSGVAANLGAPLLHFEIRRGTEAVDPLDYLGVAVGALFRPGEALQPRV